MTILTYNNSDKFFWLLDCKTPFEYTIRGWIYDKKSKALRTDNYHLAKKAAQFIQPKDFKTGKALLSMKNRAEFLYELSSSKRLPDGYADDFKSPKGLSYTDYQKSAILYIKEVGNCLLSDEMGCIAGDTELKIIRRKSSRKISMSKLYHRFNGIKIDRYRWDLQFPTYLRSLKGDAFGYHKIRKVLYKGIKPVIQIKLKSGKSIKLTPDHEVLTPEGYKPAGTLPVGSRVITNGKELIFLPREDVVESVSSAGSTEVYDIVMEDPYRNFVANGIVVHNCGKSIEAIGAINNCNDINTVLVICPATLRINWYSELRKWLIKYYHIYIVSPSTKKIPDYAEIVIINYDLLAKHDSDIKSKIWDIMIVDESHYIKNYAAKRTINVIGRSTWPKSPGISAKRKLFLSGTPVINRPAELWTTWAYLYPESAPSKSSFEDRYGGVRIGRIETKPKNLDELQTAIRSKFMIRRLKKDVLSQLPEKYRMIIDIADSKALRNEQAAIRGLKNDFEAKAIKMKDDTFAVFAELAKIRHQTALQKVKPAIDRIVSTLDNDQKMGVFAYHRDVIEELRKALFRRNIKHVAIHGGTKHGDRHNFVQQFQTDEDTRVFIGNIAAAGVGITLTAANICLFVELDWTHASLVQAEDRFHRIGQENAVLIQYLVIDGTIDAKMAKAVLRKKVITEALLNETVKDSAGSDLINLNEIF